MSTQTPLHLGELQDAIRSALFVAALTFITLLGVAVRASHLSHPMRYDESYNYLHYVSQGPVHIVTHYVPNNHILHTLCVWTAGRIAGHSPAALRIPAFIAGILLIPATAWLAWALSRRFSVALLSSLAICCSSALIEYSVNARGYSMFALFAVIAAMSLFRALQLPEQRWRWIGWSVIGAAGMYTVPIMALPLLGMFAVSSVATVVTMDASRRSAVLRGLGWGMTTCLILTILAYLPVWWVGGLEAFTKSQDLAYELLGAQISSPMQMTLVTFEFWTRHAPLILVITMALGAMIYLIQCFRKRETYRWVAVGMVIVPFVAAIAASAPLPARTWLFALPFVFVMAVLGLSEVMADHSSVMRTFIGYGIQGAVALVFIISLSQVWKSDYLCSEPRGLVLVEPALEECKTFGEERCALISPYTPAAAYYKSRIGVTPLVDSSSADAQRIYILTSIDRNLDDLWRPGVGGYGHFTQPQLLWKQPGGSLYVAERADRNALR